MQSDDLAQYSPDPSLTPQQHHVLSLLAEGHSIIDAAEAVGIHRNTIRNWRRCVPAFAREIEFAVREQALVWHEQAIQLAPLAAKTLSDILNDSTASPALRLRASLAVLKVAADPQPRSLRPFPTVPAEMEAVQGEILKFRAAMERQTEGQNVRAATTPIPAQSCTMPIRRASEPGRNTPCPCGSGQKFKRCCAQLRTTPATDPGTRTETLAKTA
jgi:transposase-like protein